MCAYNAHQRLADRFRPFRTQTQRLSSTRRYHLRAVSLPDTKGPGHPRLGPFVAADGACSVGVPRWGSLAAVRRLRARPFSTASRSRALLVLLKSGQLQVPPSPPLASSHFPVYGGGRDQGLAVALVAIFLPDD